MKLVLNGDVSLRCSIIDAVQAGARHQKRKLKLRPLSAPVGRDLQRKRTLSHSNDRERCDSEVFLSGVPVDEL